MYNGIGNGGYVMENKNKYLEILDKDPHNFDALKGLLCAEFKWDDLEQMKEFDRVGRYANRESKIEELRDKALDEDKKFFEEFKEFYLLSKKYLELTDEVDSCEKDAKHRTTQESTASLVDIGVTYDPYIPPGPTIISENMIIPTIILAIVGFPLWGILTYIFGVPGAIVGGLIYLAGFTCLMIRHQKLSKGHHQERETNIANNKRRMEESEVALTHARSELNVTRTTMYRKAEWLLSYRR